MTIPGQIILQIILILVNAFFAMTEIAVISLNPAKLKKLEADGDKAAPKLLKLIEQPSGFLSTIQIGITLAGFLGSAFAADGFSEPLVNWLYNDVGFHSLSPSTLDTIAVIIITLILSYFTLVLGELVPKRIAMQKPLVVARFSAGVVSALSVIVKPIVWFLSASTNAVLKLLHMKTEAEEETVTEEEIRMMLDLGEEKGTIESVEGEWIDNVFEFGDTSVRETMTHVTDVVAICVSDSSEDIINTIQKSGLSRFPVYDKNINDILGILNAREFLLDRLNPVPKPIKELIRSAYFIPDTINASVVFKDMQQKKIHIAVVIDEYGETAGVITIEDLLEEIVGNIYDEFDHAEPPEIEKLSDNLWRASGTISIDTLSDTLGITLPDDLEYDTLGGMVFSCLHTIPKDKTPFDVEVHGLNIHVDSIENRRIKTAIIKKIEL